MHYAAIVLTLIAVSAQASEFSVTEAGAVGDGKTDCTAAFQKALDDAGKAGGGIVQVPTGRYRVNGTLSVPAAVTLQGTYRTAPLAHTQGIDKMPGSVLLAYSGRGSAEGKPFITLAGGAATAAGLIIAYPEVNYKESPPIAYPPCIDGGTNNENVAVIDCAILNAYDALRFVTSHRHLVRNVQGYPMHRGIYVDQCYDIGRIENVHFWPFGGQYGNDALPQWINLNAVAFEFARTDWEYVTNTFCFGYGVGYKFSETKFGSANGSFLAIGADSCMRPLLVEQAQFPGLLITNGEFVGKWGSSDAVGAEIGEKASGKVSLTNCSFWGPLDRCVWMRSPVGQFTANACHFNNWDVAVKGSPAVQIDAGRAIIQGCTFGSGSVDILVGKNTRSAIITANQAVEGLVIQNNAGKRTQAVANEEGLPPLPAAALSHYVVHVGTAGDERFVRGWHGGESGGEWPGGGTKRWSAPTARLILQVTPGKQYQVTIDAVVPEWAMEPCAGFYLNGKNIAPIKKIGINVLKGIIPPQKAGQVILELKVKNWLPKENIPNSQDGRSLGIAVRSVTMLEAGSKKAAVDANSANP